MAFELRPNGDVVIKSVASPASALRAALQKVRGSANATAFKDMGTDEFMRFLRG